MPMNKSNRICGLSESLARLGLAWLSTIQIDYKYYQIGLAGSLVGQTSERRQDKTRLNKTRLNQTKPDKIEPN